MSLLTRLSTSITDRRYSFDNVRDFNEGFDEVYRRIPALDVVQHIWGHFQEDINKEMLRIFQSEGWSWPFRSRQNQHFAQCFVPCITELTLCPEAEKHGKEIASRIGEMTNLSKVTVMISGECTESQNRERVQFYQTTISKNKKIRHIAFKEGVTLSQLAAATSGLALESLEISSLSRNANREADAKGSKDLLAAVLSKMPNLRALAINEAELKDGALARICQSCSKIETLNAAYNNLTWESLASIVQHLPKLTALDIRDMKDVRPKNFADLRSLPLRSLNIGYCFPVWCRGVFEPIKSITTLTALDVSGLLLSLNELKELASFQSLKVLNMNGCTLEKGSQDIFNPWPTHLDVSTGIAKVKPTTFATSIGQIGSLEDLDIQGCTDPRGWEVSLADIAYLLKHLDRLHLFKANILFINEPFVKELIAGCIEKNPSFSYEFVVFDSKKYPRKIIPESSKPVTTEEYKALLGSIGLETPDPLKSV